jgi:hypothetical protein
MPFQKDITPHYIPSQSSQTIPPNATNTSPHNPTTERDKYIEEAKARAREYLALGRPADAIASMLSDMNKRKDCHVSEQLAELGLIILMKDYRNGLREVELYIEGFH